MVNVLALPQALGWQETRSCTAQGSVLLDWIELESIDCPRHHWSIPRSCARSHVIIIVFFLCWPGEVDAAALNVEEEVENHSDYPVVPASLSGSEAVKDLGVPSSQEVVMFSTHQPLDSNEGMGVLEGDGEVGCDIVGNVADDRWDHVQYDGKCLRFTIIVGLWILVSNVSIYT